MIVGATFTGAEVAEWLHAATIAIVSKTPVTMLWQAVPAFPTRSEIWLKLLERREIGLAGERATRRSAAKPAAATHTQSARSRSEPLVAATGRCSASRARDAATGRPR